ncbi:PREDICTED: uncharacterized protein LOC109470607 [Branchiostoma belcheri]|uniref:Uncharacterized protein LOC109470607 n=1 Tax=Branchiostoma belcheri TaxID=7741 RepID=A0A6P4YTT2_BRABE|nr:PREDICTED: uncharacterized protein LOC109470607 [Branchiostoma belcheri]
MAGLQSEFSELIELLEKVHHSCEKKRQEVELSCQDYREILAPWPDEGKSAKQGQEREQEAEVSKGEGATGDIPEREIQELKLLDNVLAKAQKVRKRHERTVREDDLPDEVIINETTVETSNQRYDEENCKVKDDGERTESGRINQQVGNGTSRGKTVQGNDQVATISKTKLNRLINTSSAKTPSVSVKVLPPKSSRPPVGVKKSYKLQAPYKTEPTRPKVPSRSQRPGSRPISASARTSQVSQTRSLSTRPNVTLASRKVPDNKKRTVTRPPSHQHENNVVSSSVTKHAASTSEDLPEMRKEVGRNPANQQSADIAKWLEDVKLSGIGEGDQVTTAALQHEEDQDTEKKRFLLKDDASKIVIPGKWKKLCVQNHKLRQKVQEMQLKLEQSTHRQHFVDRLESRFSNNEEYSDVEVPYTLVDIQRKKGRLLEMVEEADIQSLSQESSWQDICHVKVLLEFVHSQLQELISDVSQIENMSAVRNSKQVQLSALTSAEGMSDTTSSVNSQMWLPDELVQRKCVEMSSFPEPMVYHDPKDLKRIVTLQHEAQILQLQIHIQKLVGDKILPMLQTMDRKNPMFLSLYRTVYSILTTGGERFPTLVRDV